MTGLSLPWDVAALPDGALWTYDGRPGHYTWTRVPGTTLS
jgi:hypothetical protein